MSDKWNGEARGCADVMFTRIVNLRRNRIPKDVSQQFHYRMDNCVLEQFDLDDCVMALAHACVTKGIRLTDILEDSYMKLKEDV